MMKSAAVLSRKGILYFHSQSRTTAGVWIAAAPFLRVEQHDSTARKGEAALECLNESKDGVPHPTKWDLLTTLFELAGVKSWSTLVRNAKSLDLEMEDGRLKVIPTKNLGRKDGFEPISERAVELRMISSPEEIGAAVEEALARSQ